MRSFLLYFLFLNVSAVQAQKDSVRLVDIQSSECKAMIEVRPGFVKKEMIGDTTYLDLFCSNNCGGYYDPQVKLSGDSVLITIKGGTPTYEPVMMYKVNDEWLSLRDWNYFQKKAWPRVECTDSAVFVTMTGLSMAMCNCCYRFELKIEGLDTEKTYNYFYNGQYIDPTYKTTGEVKMYQFPYFLKVPQYEVFEELKKIVYKSKDKVLLKDLHDLNLNIYLTVDTIDGSIDNIEIDYPYDRIKYKELTGEKITDYFRSLYSVIPIQNPSKTKWFREYMISFGFDRETDKLKISFEPGEDIR